MKTKLAYLILAHRNPHQLGRLVKAIHSPSNYYLIHMDRKADADCHRVVREIAARYPNVRVMRSGICRWGGYSVLNTELRAIRQLLDEETDWDFFINLSGQDFPLRTQGEITSYLGGYKNQNFMWIHDPSESGLWPDAVERVRGVYVEVPFYPELIKLPRVEVERRFMLGGDTWYGGATWLILSREFCSYAIKSGRARKLRRFFRHTLLADESFFQTAIMGSEYQQTLVNDYKRHIRWADSASPHPKVFTVNDFEELIQSDDFFARKFDESVDGVVIDKLEEHLACRGRATFSPGANHPVSEKRTPPEPPKA